ncbi:expressed unknown protein [Seminavis robusta]|uniref:Uncharacterized protein n=1 Tax=Seminavis robusta TaxID=568900 RepID=A0A9N8HXY8_9STRA|nr:expressed unknown protein [Seminavis robusta]|eukprot:Sro2629_g333060.1 n/a (366) ;mRNA; r:2910-4007
MFQPTIATNKTKNYNSKKKQSSSQSSNNDVEWSQSQFDVDGDNSQDHNGKPPKDPEVSFITPVDAVLQALQEHIRRNVRRNVQTKSGKRNGFGLALFGTRKRTRVDIDELLAANRDKRRFGKQKQTKKNDDDDNSLVEEEEAEKKKKDSDEDSDSDDSDDDDDDMRPKSNRASGRTTIHHLIALEPPGVDTVKILRQCLMPDNNEQQEDEEDRRMLDLKHLFGHKPQKQQDDDFLSDSLLIALNDITGTFKDAEKNGGCVHKLRTPAEKIGNDKKCIWIVTNQDDFCKRDPERQRIIQTTVQDLRNNGFEIKGWPLPPPTGKRSAVAARKESCFFDKIADIPDDLRQMLQRAMKGRRSSSSSARE